MPAVQEGVQGRGRTKVLGGDVAACYARVAVVHAEGVLDV